MMLQVIHSESGLQLRACFTDGPHQGQRYLAAVTCCDNPVCECGHLHLLVEPERGDVPQENTGPAFGVDLDVVETKLSDVLEGRSAHERNFGRELCEYLDEQDWRLLGALYLGFKRQATETTPDNDIDTQFPVDAIERDSLMVAMQEVLPFVELPRVEVDGRPYLLGDQYCVKVGCPCCEAYVTFIPEGTSDTADLQNRPAVLHLDYRNGKTEVKEKGGESPATLRNMGARLRSSKQRAVFRRRHARLRSLYRLYLNRHPEVLRTRETAAITAKVGRNDPCPCGSGKKYKRCCLPASSSGRS